MNKKTGEELDRIMSRDLQVSFTDFIKSYAVLIENVESFLQTKAAERLFDDSEEAINKYNATSELADLLSNMVPVFIKIAAIEDKIL